MFTPIWAVDSQSQHRTWHDPMAVAGRRHPARGVLMIPGKTPIVFVTVATKNREPWMAAATVQRSLHEIWSQEALAWRVGSYLVMPDHLHLLCAPGDPHVAIEHWIQFWKAQFSRRHRMESWSFQRDAFHHRVRNAQEYEETWHYILENPIRKGLVERPEDWPFQGAIFDLRV